MHVKYTRQPLHCVHHFVVHTERLPEENTTIGKARPRKSAGIRSLEIEEKKLDIFQKKTRFSSR